MFGDVSRDGIKAEFARGLAKVCRKIEAPIPTQFEVHLPNSSFSVRLRVYPPECAPFRLVSGFFAALDVSSAGSSRLSPVSVALISENDFKKVGVQMDHDLLQAHACSNLNFDGGNVNAKSGEVIPAQNTSVLLRTSSVREAGQQNLTSTHGMLSADPFRKSIGLELNCGIVREVREQQQHLIVLLEIGSITPVDPMHELQSSGLGFQSTVRVVEGQVQPLVELPLTEFRPVQLSMQDQQQPGAGSVINASGA